MPAKRPVDFLTVIMFTNVFQLWMRFTRPGEKLSVVTDSDNDAKYSATTGQQLSFMVVV